MMSAPNTSIVDIQDLHAVERRVLWLRTVIVYWANNVRPKTDPLKVGGHQASSASCASLMTALYFGHLAADDRVSVQPHASPALYAIGFLLGRLEAEDLKTLREFGGLQSYPSQTKNPELVDFSTGSVGLNATAANYAALAQAYISTHVDEAQGPGSHWSIVGDAELDEGNVWKTVAEPLLDGVPGIRWIVDLNRQSLDRIVPGVRIDRLKQMFAANGWRVIEAKYGHALRELFERDGGAHCAVASTTCRTRSIGCSAPRARHRFDPASLHAWPTMSGATSKRLSPDSMMSNSIAASRVSVATTSRCCWSATRKRTRIQLLRLCSRTPSRDGGSLCWEPRKPLGPHDQRSDGRVVELARHRNRLVRLVVGQRSGCHHCRDGTCSPLANAHRRVRSDRCASATCAAPTTDIQHTGGLRKALLELTRSAPEVAARVVTAAPDVAASTNLAGWINKVGVWRATEHESFLEEGLTALCWNETPAGRHLELGISEMNLFSLLGQLGLTAERHGTTLLPIGTVYNTLISRGLDALIYGLYCESRFLWSER